MSTLIYPLSSPFRWDTYRADPRKTPLDALNNWEGFSGAKVEWDESYCRAPNNAIIHIMTPLVSCQQHYLVGDHMMPHVRRVCGRHEKPRDVVGQALLERLGSSEVLVDFDCHGKYDAQGRYVVWTTQYISQLVRVPIQTCEARGPNKIDTKHAAASALLRSGHCMICLKR